MVEFQGCYTEKERHEILVNAYDAHTQAQINVENQRREYLERVTSGKGGFTLADLYRTFEQENLGYINDLHIEFGVMRTLMERFPDDDTIKQWAEYFIRLNGYEIESLMGEIEYDRQTAREIEGVQR